MNINLRKYMDGLLLYESDPRKYQGAEDICFEELTKELLNSEEEAKQFFRECNDHEFDLSAYAFDELADKFGVPFIKWLVEEASHRKLTEYGLGELEAIQVNADLIPLRKPRY